MVSSLALREDFWQRISMPSLIRDSAGFMSVIAVSSMLPQAIRNDARDGFLFTLFFFIGIAIIGLSGALTD